MSELQPDLDIARRFLAALDPENRVGAKHAFHTVPDVRRPTQDQSWNLARSPDRYPEFDASLDEAAPRLLDFNLRGAAVHVTVNDQRDNTLILRACCCEWTGGTFGIHDGYSVPLRPVPALSDASPSVGAGPAPSMVVRTPHGVQWWWLLHAREDDPAEALEKWQAVQQALARQYGGSSGLERSDVTLRVPGFIYRREDPQDLSLYSRVQEEARARIIRGDYEFSWNSPASAALVAKEYAARGGTFAAPGTVLLEKCDPELRYEIGRIVRGLDLDLDPLPEIVPPAPIPIPAPHLEITKQFLSVLDPTSERFTYQTADDRGADPDLARIFHGPIDEIAPTLATFNARGAAIYVGINATDFQGRKNKNVLTTRAFFCDWDDQPPPRGSGALPLSILVARDAGGKRKYHGYWRISEPVEHERWKVVQSALVRRLEADTGAVLLNQALRLPGFFNNKGAPILVEIDECHPERVYTVEQVIEAYQLEEIMRPPAPRPERTSQEGGPADDFNERGDWSMLERAGWVSIRHDGDEQKWTKPGGQRREIHATTDHDGHTGIFKNFSSKAPPFSTEKAYSRFQVLAILEFSGDYSATAKHLVAQGYGKSSVQRKQEFAAAAEDGRWNATMRDEPVSSARIVKIDGAQPPENPDFAALSSSPGPLYQPSAGGSGGGGDGDGDGDGDGALRLPEVTAPVLSPLRSIKTYANGPDQLVMSHFGNSERFLDRYGLAVCYVKTFDSWFIWNGLRWRKDRDAEETHVRPPTPAGNALSDYLAACRPDPFDAGNYVQELAKQVVRSMHALTDQVRRSKRDDEGNIVHDTHGKPEIDKGKTASARKDWIGHCVSSESENGVRQILNLSRSDREVARFPSYFDPYDHLINTQSGVYDLCNGITHPHHPTLLQSKLVRIKPKRGGCPTWTKFLSRVLQEDDDLIRFVQRAVGYSLTGETREQVLFLLYGTGRNGKSTFLNVLHALAGEYAQHAEFSTFVERQSETVRNDLARLHKSRLVTAVEPKASGYLDESVIKQVTGQDVVTARFLFQEHFEYVPRFKIWLAANHKPMIRGNDEGIWRRILMVPFTVTIPEEEKDPDLPRKLIAELPAIFAWAADGARLWYQEGLNTPAAVREATQAYRDDMDSIGMFLNTVCVLTDGVRARATALYERYRNWTERGGEKPMSQKKFGMRLEERGIGKKRTKNGYEYHGIGIVDDSPGGSSHAGRYNDD